MSTGENAFEIPQDPNDRFGDHDLEGGAVGPAASSAPKVFGILNLVYYGLFGLCCGGLYAVMMLFWTSGVSAAESAIGPEYDKQLVEARAEVDAAEDDATRKTKQERLDNLEAGDPRPMLALLKGMFTPATLRAGSVDGVLHLLLTIGLITCGVGLLQYREWARSGCVWLSVLKVLLIAAMLVVNIAFLMEDQLVATEKFQQGMQEWQQKAGGQAGGNPFGGGASKAAVIVQSVIGAAFTMAYPVVCIVVLSLKDPRRACRTSA